MTLKRYRQDTEVESLAMANCLMLLSRSRHDTTASALSDRVFECKTCGRKFTSFQALGGHRTSHKKPRLAAEDLLLLPGSPPAKLKMHECPICGVEFAIGQALGGHMRRHRAAGKEAAKEAEANQAIRVPVLNSGRVLCLDLNLTPYENYLRKMTPLMHCFI